MAQSHIKLTGGVGDGRRISNTIQQVAHGFIVGNIIRYNRVAATGSGTNQYVLAKADSAENSEVVGVVTAVNGNDSFELTYNGEIDTSSFDPSLTLDDDDVFFLSDTTAGKPVSTPPVSAGSVIKPVLIRTANDTAVITNFIGTVIGGTSVVSLEGIQPVATVEPYAGSISDVPDTWSVCDGGALLITDYPELYDRIGRTYGYQTKLSGIDGSVLSQIAVGQQVKNMSGGSSVLSTGVIAEKGANYIIVDVNYLEASGDAYTQNSTLFGVNGPSQSFDVPNGSGLNSEYTGSIVTPSSQPTNDVSLGSVTVEQLYFRKPDLRGKFVLGVANDAAATITALELPSAFTRGQIGGDYQTDASGTGTLTVGGSSAVANIPPYQALNWIIKTTPRAKAALLDNLVAGFKLSDLADVNAPETTAQSGDIIVYDATSPEGAKYRPYRLFTDYPDDGENVFRISMSGGKPLFQIGNGAGSAGFNIHLPGLQSQNFQVVDDSGVSLSVDNTSVKIGTKGLKFTNGDSQIITGVKKSVRNSSNAEHGMLVTEKAVRTALDSVFGFNNLTFKSTNTTSLNVGDIATIQHGAKVGNNVTLTWGSSSSGHVYFLFTFQGNSDGSGYEYSQLGPCGIINNTFTLPQIASSRVGFVVRIA